LTFEDTPIPGVFIIHLAPIHDERGFFARAFGADEFRARGMNPDIVQAHLSLNTRRGVLRGMHYQRAPAAEAKLVRCVRGSIFDVVVDMRQESESYLQWVSCELSAANRKALYLPEGCAHGFQTLEDDCEVFYHVSHVYAPELADGFRYDDPAVGIRWPQPVSVISPRDKAWPPLVVPTAKIQR
jgi:dTDP-4-dehydrorhamnose 3,5-epimerase